MTARLLPLALCALASAALTAQVTYNGRGNGANDSDNAVASGAMTLSDDGTALTIELRVRTGFNYVPENVVLYLDTKAGGFVDNSAFTDVADAPRAAASGRNRSGQLAPLTFPQGFEVDYAVIVRNGVTTVFELVDDGTHIYRYGAPQSTEIHAAPEATVTTAIPLSTIGSPSDIVFVSAYRFQDGSLTDESYTEDIADGNPGFAATAFTQTATYTTSGTLPVSLRAFAAAAVTDGVALTWETASERDNAGFAVERSRDGVDWREIGFVDGAGHAEAVTAYAYTDDGATSGTYYYRLRQVDFDGAESFGPVVTVTAEVGDDAGVGSALQLEGEHPVSGMAAFRNVTSAPVRASLSDAAGRSLRQFTVAADTVHRLALDGLSPGLYVLHAGRQAQRLVIR